MESQERVIHLKRAVIALPFHFPNIGSDNGLGPCPVLPLCGYCIEPRKKVAQITPCKPPKTVTLLLGQHHLDAPGVNSREAQVPECWQQVAGEQAGVLRLRAPSQIRHEIRLVQIDKLPK